MNTKLARKIVAATITSLILVAVGLSPSLRIADSPLAAEEPLDNSEYPYCCQGNQSGWGRGRYRGGRYNGKYYDLNNIETLDGKVISVERYRSRRGVSQGVHLLFNTGKETLKVHLGPSWYLEDRDFAIAPEDKIEIVGSRINIEGEPAIVASQIKRGSETLILRDDNGFPLWRGGRR